MKKITENYYLYCFICRAGSLVYGGIPAENKKQAKSMIDEWYSDDDEEYKIKKWLSCKKQSLKHFRKAGVRLLGNNWVPF